MILISLQGGLGNQMFQYAIARILGEKNHTPVVLEKSFFILKEKKPGHTPRDFELNIFNNEYLISSDLHVNKFTNLSFLNKVRKKLGCNYPKTFLEEKFTFNPEALLVKPPVILHGYFQSYKYYDGYEALVKQIFEFPVNKLDEVNSSLLYRIKETTAISIHIRRGDFINDMKTKTFHGNCSIDYYLKAINFFVSKFSGFQLFFFSDDSEWVKEKFETLPNPKLFIDHNKGENNWKDMFLMSSCSHNIIANSSFSWWAAWLNNNPNKTVIAPKNWFAKDIDTNDLIPDQWIRL
ncbi:glycosyl transferase family 11 [Gillisia mitskevichiae]|uniref:Glycosyl transferase family 11 n=1 Tax=Gillisia mitskevichiae TaxID=270921 RepID=A0A495P6V0_9FLAO|nr:glycosyl transferase family 11 [Gillisia mitskevichiae]